MVITDEISGINDRIRAIREAEIREAEAREAEAREAEATEDSGG